LEKLSSILKRKLRRLIDDVKDEGAETDSDPF